MKTNKIIALFTALVLVLGLFSVQISAADAKNAVVWVENVEANAGDEVTVTVKANAIAALFTFEVAYDAEKFAYVADSFAAENAVALGSAEAGKITFGRSESSNVTYENAVVATFKLATPAADNAVFAEAAMFTSDVTIAVVEADLGGFTEPDFYNADGDNLVIGDGYTATFTKGAVTVKKAHKAPTFEVAIAGEAKNGVELEATVSNFVDNWALTPAYAYQWSVDGVAVADATTSKFALTAAEIGKVVSVAVTATVEAEEEPTATVEAATEAVAIDPTMLPVVTNVAFDKDSVKVGSAVVVTYDYEDGNALDDASVITFVKADAADAEEWVEAVADTDYTVSEDGKVKFTKEVKGMFIKISVLATNAEEIAAEAATLSEVAYEVKAKASSGSGSMSGPNLANPTPSKPVEEPKDEPTEEPKDEEPTVEPTVDPIKNAPADKLVLAIGNANVSVFGEVVANDVAPIIVADRTMLPARIVAESLGAEVAWDAEARVVTITKGEVTIVLTIDSNKALVNGAEVELDSAAFIANDRTYTPVRFIAEALAATVEWDAATQAVTITPAK